MEEAGLGEAECLSGETAAGAEEAELLGELSGAEVERVRAIQRLLRAGGGVEYQRAQAAVARQLGLSESSVKRLVGQWRQQGLKGLVRQVRSDRGEHRVGEAWQEFIIKTYRAGNRGGRALSAAQVAVRVASRASELGEAEYPSRSTVYRVLRGEIEQRQQRQQKRSLGWRGERLRLKTKGGQDLEIIESNQVWQCDHTRVDLLVVDQSGELLGRPWLTIVVDSYSRCIMGLHLGMEAPSAIVVCLALRHAILPKQYGGGYELSQSWGTYGIPQYLYTDGGKDFQSQHLEQVATELGIVSEQRRYPSEGGIVERPFGTLNSELFSSLPGYTGSNVAKRPKQAERAASLTLIELEKLLVRYIVERYNQSIDARMGNQSRIERWEAGSERQLPLIGERELDICLMRQERRVVYRGGYIQFANLTYRGEHLGGHAGESIVIRYNPRDITSVLIYQCSGAKDVFVARAHAQGLETECLSLAEAQAISRRVRAAGRVVSNQSLLLEVQRRDSEVKQLRRGRKQKRVPEAVEAVEESLPLAAPSVSIPVVTQAIAVVKDDGAGEHDLLTQPVPEVVVHDYEEWKQEYGLW